MEYTAYWRSYSRSGETPADAITALLDEYGYENLDLDAVMEISISGPDGLEAVIPFSMIDFEAAVMDEIKEKEVKA